MSFVRSYFRSPPAVIGLLLLLAVIAMAITAGWLYPRDPLALAGRPLVWPFSNPRFPLGTDNSGRDIAAPVGVDAFAQGGGELGVVPLHRGLQRGADRALTLGAVAGRAVAREDFLARVGDARRLAGGWGIVRGGVGLGRGCAGAALGGVFAVAGARHLTARLLGGAARGVAHDRRSDPGAARQAHHQDHRHAAL